MEPGPEHLIEVAREAAQAAAAVHRQYAGRIGVGEWAEKAAADFVTVVDREAEAAIISCLLHAFPDHSVLAEEQAGMGLNPAQADWQWIVDPLDGTTNYLHRYPMYAVSIAAAHRGQVMAGLVLDSANGSEWSAVRGGGAWQDGKAIRVSAIATMHHALIGTGFPFKMLERLPEYSAQFAQVLAATSGIRRAGAAAIDLCHVASGYFDGFWELALAPWDVAAGALIVREAGGFVSRLDGELDAFGHGPVVAGNPAIHAELLALLRTQRRLLQREGATA